MSKPDDSGVAANEHRTGYEETFGFPKEPYAAPVRYLNLDRLGAAIGGYLAYRVAVTRCFFSGPRIGHDYEGGGLTANCKRCPKVWIGNV